MITTHLILLGFFEGQAANIPGPQVAVTSAIELEVGAQIEIALDAGASSEIKLDVGAN
jgi:hypothetical protein